MTPPFSWSGTNSPDMITHDAPVGGRVVVDGVAVVVRLAGAQLVAPLPEQIAAHAVVGQRQGGLLPRSLYVAVVGG